ncbi:MAG: hypothetical protein AB1439_00790 [candidate division FCPU426 bacterium]
MKTKPSHRESADLAPLMRERLSGPVLGRLRAAGRTAERQGLKIYAVGGFVRDLLLGRQNEDVDLVVEGPGIALARHFARQWRAEVRVHERFGTAALRLPGGGKVDVATARAESYPQPAALPQVSAAGLERDLRRRDFTVNAMAIRLVSAAFGQLVDPLAGAEDLEAGLIRILHPQSFIDDPTRIFRAARFEQRFGFRLEAETGRCLAAAVGLVSRLSGPRVLHEVLLVLDEAQPAGILRRLSQLGVLGQVRPALADPGRLARGFDAALRSLTYADRHLGRPVDRRLVLLMALLDDLTVAEAEAWAAHHQLPRGLKSVLLREKSRGAAARQQLASGREDEVARGAAVFKTLPEEVLLFAMAKTSALRPAELLRKLLRERGAVPARTHA